jgi:BirA family transcriptional regulator, biotin operon repressor / biotin---[acetyl-CoA-carboxylase] ligase
MNSLSAIRRQSAIDDLLSQGWLKHIEWQSQVTSTNDLAKLWMEGRAAISNHQVAALFVADQQTRGRGRGGNVWWSPAGCLMLTLAVSLDQLPSDRSEHSRLALIAGLAVAEVTDNLLGGRRSQLKWPNDVYVEQRKLAGILIESMTNGWAIGIGINVQMDWSLCPTELRQRATCLSTIAGKHIHRESVLVELLPKLESRLAAWRGNEPWQPEWQSRCLLSGREVCIKAPSGLIVGICEGIDGFGKLLVRTSSHLHEVIAGEVVEW